MDAGFSTITATRPRKKVQLDGTRPRVGPNGRKGQIGRRNGDHPSNAQSDQMSDQNADEPTPGLLLGEPDESANPGDKGNYDAGDRQEAHRHVLQARDKPHDGDQKDHKAPDIEPRQHSLGHQEFSFEALCQQVNAKLASHLNATTEVAIRGQLPNDRVGWASAKRGTADGHLAEEQEHAV